MCPSCDATLRLEEEGEGWRVVSFVPPAPPAGLTVEVDEPPVRDTAGYRDARIARGRFRASRRWWTPVVLFLTFFTACWDGFLVFWYSVVLTMVDGAGPGLVFVLFPLIHVAVGVGLTWYVLASWVNRTWIDVRDGRLECRHGPIPWPFGSPEPVALEAVELFETREQVTRSRRGGAGRSWTVVARTRDGRHVTVVTHLAEEPQARFLVGRLHAQLG